MSKRKTLFIPVIGLVILLIALITGTVVFFLRRTPVETDLDAGKNGGVSSVVQPQTPGITPDVPEPGLPSPPGQTVDPETGQGAEPEPGSEPGSEPGAEPGAEPETGSGTGPEQPAEPLLRSDDLTGELTLTISDGKRAATLLDRDYTTRHAFSAGASVTIDAPEEIHSLYIIWALPPGEWELAGKETLTFGKDGFIHEYINLPDPSSQLTMYLPRGGSTICDIYAFTKGLPPDWVQIWDPPLQKADMLLLPTHADDEHLYFAGLMPLYAGELGYNVQVAYLTNHWNQPPRPHELLNGLWAVGIRNYPVIGGFRDRYAESLSQATSIFGWDNVVDYQVELLRRFKPSVVVGHDLNGEYGHGVHMLNARALLTAVELAADREYHAISNGLYGVWDTPKLYLHLYRENAINMDWSVPLERFNGATAYDMAVIGYSFHKSQHGWSFAVPASGPRGHLFGLARSLVGVDTAGGDMFENIGFYRSSMNDGIMIFD